MRTPSSPASPRPRNVFLSYHHGDSIFVIEVARWLNRCFDHVFCFQDAPQTNNMTMAMSQALDQASILIFFVGAGTAGSKWQQMEADAALRGDNLRILIQLDDTNGRPFPVPSYARLFSIQYAAKRGNPGEAKRIAALICQNTDQPWRGSDGLPVEPLFTYEKRMIKFFGGLYDKLGSITDYARSGQTAVSKEEELRLRMEQLPAEWIEKFVKGCPLAWPEVTRRIGKLDKRNNLIGSIGDERSDQAKVLVSALLSDNSCGRPMLSFPEAGPRARICFPRPNDHRFKVAIMVVGGIAPGINAVIDGIVQRHYLYADADGYADDLDVYGLVNGVHAFEAFDESHVKLVCDTHRHKGENRRLETAQHAHEGGSILGTCRDDELINDPLRNEKLAHIVRTLRHHDILYVIGGDGGMRLAHAIQCKANELGQELSVIGIPKTMDNDILWVWQSFGFMSAVEKAREVVELIHTEITSNPRLGIVQLFGSVSGFVVSHAVLASSTPDCYLALVPEVPFSLHEVADYLAPKLKKRGGLLGGLIVMAESALPTDALAIIQELETTGKNPGPLLSQDERDAVAEYLKVKNAHKTFSGQTSDHLRTACLKIVSKGLELLLKARSKEPKDAWDKLRVVTSEPRHIIRAIPPSCLDIITGRRLGGLAVDGAMAGYRDFMISQWLTEFVLVPLQLVVLGRKQIQPDGIFWKSVLAKTGSWDCFKSKGNTKSSAVPMKSAAGKPPARKKASPRVKRR